MQTSQTGFSLRVAYKSDAEFDRHAKENLAANDWRRRAGSRPGWLRHDTRAHHHSRYGGPHTAVVHLDPPAGRGPGPFTVFAPTDEAFKAVPAATMARLASDKALLRSVLTFHVVPGKVMAAEVKNGPAKSVQGANLALSRAGTFVTVEEAVVQVADVPVTNGVVHIIDTVLIPPPAPSR